MWSNIITETSYMNNFNMGYSNNKTDILIHLTQWQYWWWFWFTFLWVLYYLLVARIFRFRTLKFSPRIASTLRPHGKWGDLLTCLIPLTWCINILISSNFILKLIEWQSESSLFTLRVRAKQWYWIYKLDLRNISDIYSVPKNIGRNRWQSFTFGDLQTSDDYLHILQMRAYNIWSKDFWNILNKEHISTDKFSVNSPITIFRQEFINNANTTLLNNVLSRNNLSVRNLYKVRVFKHNYLFKEDSMVKNSIRFDCTSLIRGFLFENAENSHPRIKVNGEVLNTVQEKLDNKTWDPKKRFWMLNSILPGNGILKKELLFNKFMFKTKSIYLPPIGVDLRYVSKLKKLNFYNIKKADVNYLWNIKVLELMLHKQRCKWIYNTNQLSTRYGGVHPGLYNVEFKLRKNFNLLNHFNFKSTRFIRNNFLTYFYRQEFENTKEIYNRPVAFDLKQVYKLKKKQSMRAQPYVGNTSTEPGNPDNKDFIMDTRNTPYYYNHKNYKVLKNYLRSTILDSYNNLTFLKNSPEIDDDSRITRRSFGKVAPLRILKKPINNLYFSKIKDTDLKQFELFRFRFNDNISKTSIKPIRNTVYLTFKQKRYVLRSPSFKDYVGNNKKYSTNPFLKNTNIIEENYGNGSKQYRFLKKSKNRVEKSKLSSWNRLLRSRRMLVLPAHVNITVITNSFDIVHSWHIPGLGLKMDCLPGRATHHTLYIDHVGLYYGQCAEVCGRYHHHMPIRICSLPFEHFLLWWNNIGLPKFLFTDSDNPKKNVWKNCTKTSYLSRRYVW